MAIENSQVESIDPDTDPDDKTFKKFELFRIMIKTKVMLVRFRILAVLSNV